MENIYKDFIAENSEFLENQGGICMFSQSTPALLKAWLLSIKEYLEIIDQYDDGNQKQTLIEKELLKYKFVSVGMPTKHLIPHNGVNVEYQTLRQKDQYNYIYNKLNNYTFLVFSQCRVLFEQTKQGNIHFHCIVKINEGENIHNIKAEFYDAFNIKKGKSVRHFIDVQDVNNIDGLINYLFEKDIKSYEAVNQEIFKPLRGLKYEPKPPITEVVKQEQMQKIREIYKGQFSIEL